MKFAFLFPSLDLDLAPDKELPTFFEVLSLEPCTGAGGVCSYLLS